MIFQMRSGSPLIRSRQLCRHLRTRDPDSVQQPSRTLASSKSTASSMVRNTPGSSLLNIQDYHSSPDDSSVSLISPPSTAKTGRGNSGTESRHGRSSLQFANSSTSEKRSLPPLLCQHRPNNSPVATSPCSGEFPDRLSSSKITD